MEPKGTGTIEYLPELRRILLPRTRVNKAARSWLNRDGRRVRAYRDTIAKNGGCDMAAGSSPESWVGHYVSVELAAEPGSETSIAVLRGSGLESRLEGVSEYGVVLLMVRYDEVEDKRIEYNRFYPWAQVRSVGLLDPQPKPS
jgi:hypothetical protein